MSIRSDYDYKVRIAMKSVFLVVCTLLFLGAMSSCGLESSSSYLGAIADNQYTLELERYVSEDDSYYVFEACIDMQDKKTSHCIPVFYNQEQPVRFKALRTEDALTRSVAFHSLRKQNAQKLGLAITINAGYSTALASALVSLPTPVKILLFSVAAPMVMAATYYITQAVTGEYLQKQIMEEYVSDFSASEKELFDALIQSPLARMSRDKYIKIIKEGAPFHSSEAIKDVLPKLAHHMILMEKMGAALAYNSQEGTPLITHYCLLRRDLKKLCLPLEHF